MRKRNPNTFVTINHTVTDEDDNELFQIQLECEVSPYYPGRYSGAPDYCYPAEGGEVESVTATKDAVSFDLENELTPEQYRRAMDYADSNAFDAIEKAEREDCDPPDHTEEYPW